MIKSYLTIALKHLVTERLYSLINILGLAVGLASCLLISLYLRHELSFDDWFTDADRIYRISRDYHPVAGARARVPASNNAPVTPALLEDFPQIEEAARVFGGRTLLRRGATAFYENGFRWADPSFFEIFDLEWIEGDPVTALREPASLVLTERLARKYFGADDALGETLTVDGATHLTVSGVIRDLPDNTHLSLDAAASIATLDPAMFRRWNSSTDFHTYFRLREGASVEEVERGIPAFMNRHIAEDASRWSGMTITNIRDIHLHSTRDEEWKPSGSLTTVYGFAAIAALLLAIACINFMNLATARSSKRVREVGIRKTLGASRAQLVTQFLGESLLTTALAMVAAAGIVELVLPAFGAFLEIDLRLDYFGELGVAAYLAGVTVLVGVVAGSYPAFYLSAFEPAKVLKGEVAGGGAGGLRNVLVIAQFSIAITLVIGTVVVYQQNRYTRTFDLGFDKDQVVVLTGSPAEGLGRQWTAFKERLMSHPGILGVTASHYTPFSFNDNHLSVRPAGASSLSRIQFVAVDYGFFETYRIELRAGRTFSPDFGSDVFIIPSAEAMRTTAGFVLNESAARLLGWTAEDADGQPIEIGLDENFTARVEGPVVGVVADTHFESLEVQIRPLIFVLYPELWTPRFRINLASVRLAGGDPSAALDHIDATWREFLPDQPVTRHFLASDHEALYRGWRRQGQMFAAFAALAVFVACLGLFGLTSFNTERRTKEIGIRKAMGGTVWDIVWPFTADFSKLVLIANMVAWPVAYLLMQRWLAGFAYRVEMSWAVFIGSGFAALLIAWLTVGAVAARAAGEKPVNTLRYE